MKLINILQPQFIKLPLQSTTREAVIRELIDLLAGHHILKQPDEVVQAVLDREKIMTTGVGKGVAIPHCKYNGCTEFSIALGIHPEGIDYGALDDLPVKIVFLLVGPKNNPGTHIRLLSRISRIISRESVRQKILDCSTPQQIHQLLQAEEANFFEIKS